MKSRSAQLKALRKGSKKFSLGSSHMQVSRFFAQEGIDSFSALAALVVLTPVEPQTLDQVQIPSCGGLLPPEMGPRLREGTLGPCSATEQARRSGGQVFS